MDAGDTPQHAWDLPPGVITQILATLPAAQIARCAAVASAWMQATQHCAVKDRLDLGKSWRHADRQPTKLEAGFFRTICATRRGNLIACGSLNATRIWDISRGEVIQELATSGRTCSICLLEGMLLSGDQGGNLDVWDVDQGTRQLKFRAHKSMVGCIMEVGDMIATAGDDRTVRIWNPGTWEHEHVLVETASHHIRSMVLADDGVTLLVGTMLGSVDLWDLATRVKVRVLSRRTPCVLSLSSRKDWVAVGTFGASAYLWDVKTGECLHAYKTSYDMVQCVDLDEDRLVIGCSGALLDIWDIAEHKLIRSLEPSDRPVAVWLDGSELKVANRDGSIETWDFAT